MAQQFTHTPAPPEEPASHPNQRWFLRGLSQGNNCSVYRAAEASVAQLGIRMIERSGTVLLDANLTADQCEQLARALLDAAHDLRSHPAKVPVLVTGWAA